MKWVLVYALFINASTVAPTVVTQRFVTLDACQEAIKVIDRAAEKVVRTRSQARCILDSEDLD